MDPFPEAYNSDVIKSKYAKSIPLANPKDYIFRLSWSDTTIISGDRTIQNTGWLENWSSDWIDRLDKSQLSMLIALDEEQVKVFNAFTWAEKLNEIKAKYYKYYRSCK